MELSIPSGTDDWIRHGESHYLRMSSRSQPASNLLTYSQPEWYSDIIIPWYHYVPLQMDYSDLWDIMAFFEGAPDGSTPANLDLAQRIGDSGKRFVEEHWRVEDLHSFSLLQILEVSYFSFIPSLPLVWSASSEMSLGYDTPMTSFMGHARLFNHLFSTLTVYQYQRMWSSDRKKASFGYKA
jgi:hypothetical protein